VDGFSLRYEVPVLQILVILACLRGTSCRKFAVPRHSKQIMLLFAYGLTIVTDVQMTD